MKILQLTPQFVFPPDDGGRIGIVNITKHLSELGCEITMVSLNTSQPKYQEVSVSDVYKIPVHSIHHSTKNSLSRIISSVFDKQPLYLRKHYSKQILDQTVSVLKQSKYDIIHADHTAMIPLALELKKRYSIPIGVRMHNVEWKIWQRYANQLPVYSSAKYYIQSQANKLRTHETLLLQNVDIAFPISEVDGTEISQMSPNTKQVIVPAGVNSNEWRSKPDGIRNQYELILATPWSWKHNLNGALWFIQNVLPLIRNVIPECTLTLIGKNAPPELYKMEQTGVKCLGYVESVIPFYHKASVYVAPLFVGSGVRIKILEAMAAGLPVVATTIAAEGISAKQEQGVFRCDIAEEFAKEIINLLLNPKQRELSGNAASECVTSLYEWRTGINLMYNEYRKMI